MSFAITILRRAQKQLADVAPPHYQRIRDAIRSLTNQPRPAGCTKLRGREGWRIRIGVYRVIYEINDSTQTITVLDIGHRRDIYR